MFQIGEPFHHRIGNGSTRDEMDLRLSLPGDLLKERKIPLFAGKAGSVGRDRIRQRARHIFQRRTHLIEMIFPDICDHTDGRMDHVFLGQSLIRGKNRHTLDDKRLRAERGSPPCDRKLFNNICLANPLNVYLLAGGGDIAGHGAGSFAKGCDTSSLQPAGNQSGD